MKVETLYKKCYQTIADIFEVICDLDFTEPLDLIYKKVYQEINEKNEFVIDTAGKLGVPPTYIKNVMILILASTSYMFSYNNYSRGIDSESDYIHLSLLDTLDSTSIIKRFNEDEDFGKSIINGFDNYDTGGYILQTCIKLTIIKEQMLGQILRINPLEIFNLKFYKELDQIEEMIYLIINAHDKTEFTVASDQYGEKENYDNRQDFIYNEFISALEELCNEKYDMDTIIRYLISNVYECIVVDEDLEENLKVYISYFENTSIEEIVKRFYNEPIFGYDMYELFYQYNYCLVPDDLNRRRKSFKNKKDTRYLKRINPLMGKQNEA